jgi:hypothetical protein
MAPAARPILLLSCAVLLIAPFATGCGSDDRALVRFTFFQQPGFTPDMLVLEFSDNGGGRRLTVEDFSNASGNRWDTPEFETRSAGELATSFWLVQGPDTLSSGELSLDLRPDWRWGVDIFRADEDPSVTCFGCAGALSYELAPALQRVPADSLWIVWGGNSISNPVVY